MNKRDMEAVILGTDEVARKTRSAILNNTGKLIAVCVAVVSLLVSFTDVSFDAFFEESFCPSLLFILTNGYVIYFSLVDVGENSGRESEEYLLARKRYDEAVDKLCPTDVEALREYCIAYSKRELEMRQDSALLAEGRGREELERYRRGEDMPRSVGRRLKRIADMKPYPLTPAILLEKERTQRRSELENPGTKKLLRLFLKLIPTTVCSFITVSVMLSAKDGQSAVDILNALLRLSLLPVLAFRGYKEGYLFARNSLSVWLDTKARIIEGFKSEERREPVLAR